MIKTTIKELKKTNAIDITYNTTSELQELKQKEGYYNILAYASGVYGVNGYLLQGNNTKTLYKITSRTSAIYCV